ncbi:MAG: Uncharacterised protein [Prochlorococcus marinus str. MIT 9215]|nr:MAG: Uncharacterised protein [Prochlorococcus marinus str. MIT 9215]
MIRIERTSFKGSVFGVVLSSPLLLLMLQSCSSTPLGQQLANSFDVPAEPVASETTSAIPAVNSSNSTSKASTRSSSQPADAGSLDQTSNSNSTVVSTAQNPRRADLKPVAPLAPISPQPYRIIIKLSGADPSAPAEVVTQALRRAGVNFEVETIERVKAQPTLKVMPSGAGTNP